MTDPTRVAAALAMSEGQSAIADRSQVDGVVLVGVGHAATASKGMAWALCDTVSRK
jgi:hypothetical protein